MTPVLSLEHLIPMTHVGLLQSVRGDPSFPPAAVIPTGRGRLHPAFWWNLDRTFPVRAKQNSMKPFTSSGPSFGYDCKL